MNREMVGVGVVLVITGVGLMVSPLAMNGSETWTLLVEVGVLVTVAAICVVLAGLSAPDPTRTTVSGLFGNPIENEIRERGRTAPTGGLRRDHTSPRRSVHCRQCYTLIAWNLIECPRCALARPCRSCSGPLEHRGDRIHCTQCGLEEVYCNCPGPGAGSGYRAVSRRRAV